MGSTAPFFLYRRAAYLNHGIAGFIHSSSLRSCPVLLCAFFAVCRSYALLAQPTWITEALLDPGTETLH
jgi:hypothetical protein